MSRIRSSVNRSVGPGTNAGVRCSSTSATSAGAGDARVYCNVCSSGSGVMHARSRVIGAIRCPHCKEKEAKP